LIHITNTKKKWSHFSHHFSVAGVLALLVVERKITVVLNAELKMVELL
jgi:hypothetical protein